MGYFSNGTEGEMYEETYCRRCVHYGPDEGPGCAVWLAHLLHNYDESNNADSILHVLIPIGVEGNEECSMFLEDSTQVVS